MLNARCDQLQQQIDDEKKAKEEHKKMLYEKGQETLLGEQDFDYAISEYQADSKDPRGRNVPGRFESAGSKIIDNLSSERWQEPRMFTMQQMRNIFFAMQNQSMQNTRMQTAESRLDKFNTECTRLEEMDRQIQ